MASNFNYTKARYVCDTLVGSTTAQMDPSEMGLLCLIKS